MAARARHFLINPGRKRRRTNPVLTLFGNPQGKTKRTARRNPEFTPATRARIAQKIGTLLHEGMPMKQASAVAYNEARRGTLRNPSTGGREYYKKAAGHLGTAAKEVGIGAYRSAKKYGRKSLAGAGAGLSAGWKSFRATNPRRSSTMAVRRRSRRARANSPRRRRRYSVRSNPRRVRRRTHARVNPRRRRRTLRANPSRRRRRRNPSMRANAHRRRRRRNPAARRHGRRVRRNPDFTAIAVQGAKDALYVIAGFWGTNFLSSLVPFSSTTMIPGTTASVVDTAVDVAAAGLIGLVASKTIGGDRARKVLAGGLAAAIINFLGSITNMPSQFQVGFQGYPSGQRLSGVTGTNLIGPGSVGSRALNRGMAAYPRMGSYPHIGMGH